MSTQIKDYVPPWVHPDAIDDYVDYLKDEKEEDDDKYVNFFEAIKPALIKLYGTSDLDEIEKMIIMEEKINE